MHIELCVEPYAWNKETTYAAQCRPNDSLWFCYNFMCLFIWILLLFVGTYMILLIFASYVFSLLRLFSLWNKSISSIHYKYWRNYIGRNISFLLELLMYIILLNLNEINCVHQTRLCLHRGQVNLCSSHVSIQSAWKRWLQSDIVVRCSPTSYSLRQMGQPPSVPSLLVHMSNTIPAPLSCLTGGAETKLVPTKQKK